MNRTSENISRIITEREYDLYSSRLEQLIQLATKKGYLAEQNADNEYTREIGRLSRICARYENEFMTFEFKVKQSVNHEDAVLV